MTAENELPIAPGTRLVNAFNKETFIFHDPREGLPSAEFQVLLDAGGSGGGNAVAHIHPESDEQFTVHTGVLKVMIDGVPAIARAGETVIVPRGAAHYFANAHDGPTEVTIRFTPAQSQLRFFISFATIAATRQDWFDAQGVPHKLLMALIAAHLSRPFLPRRPADLAAEGHVCSPGPYRAPQRLSSAARTRDQETEGAQRCVAGFWGGRIAAAADELTARWRSVSGGGRTWVCSRLSRFHMRPMPPTLLWLRVHRSAGGKEREN